MLGTISLALALQVAQGGVTGVVIDELTGGPLAEAVVALPGLARTSLTDREGRFRLDELPPGPHHLTVSRHGFEARTLHALVPRVGTLSLTVALAALPVELPGLTVSPRRPVRGVDPGDAGWPRDEEVRRDQIARHPTVDEPDVFRVLEGPEVAALPESHGGIHIRGGASGHTGFELDGIPILGPLHAAGLFSAWNPDAIRSIRVDDSARPAVSTLSGTIVGRTVEPSTVPRGAVAASTTQVRGSIDGPITEGSGYLLSWRQGFPGSVTFRPTDPATIRGEVGDYLGKVTLALLGGHASLLTYGSENELRTGAVANPGPLERGLHNDFDWQTRATGLTWTRAGERADLDLRGWVSTLEADVSLLAASGPAGVTSVRTERGALARVGRRLRGDVRIGVGLRLSGTEARYEGSGDVAYANSGSLTLAAAEARAEWSPSPRARIQAEVDVVHAGGATKLAPRVALDLASGASLSVGISAARRHQLTQSLRNEESMLGTVFPADLWVVADRSTVPIAVADELAARWTVRPAPGIRLGGGAYVRALRSVLFVAPSTGALYSDGGFQIGSADIVGLSLDFAASGSRFGLVADYGAQSVDHASASGSYVPSYAPAHRGQAGLVVHASPTLSLRLSHAAIWGRRGTLLDGPVEWESCNLLDGGCELAGTPSHTEELGAMSLPTYHRTDLGVRKHWHMRVRGRDSMLSAYATLTNVFDRANVLAYAFDPSTGSAETVDMLPLSPLVVGLELIF